MFEGKLEETQLQRQVLSWPTLPAQQARRAQMEGCIDLWCQKDAAGMLTRSIEEFTDLGRPGDAEVGLIYRATFYCDQGDAGKMRSDLEAAACLAEAGGFAEAVALRKLLREMDEVSDLSERILRIAFEAGGCLGPRKASK